MKKHLLICALTLLLALGCAACGGTAEKTETSTDTAETVNVARLAYRDSEGNVGVGITKVPEGINKETLGMEFDLDSDSDFGTVEIGVVKDNAGSYVARAVFSTGKGELDTETLSELEKTGKLNIISYSNPEEIETLEADIETRTETKDAQGHTVYIYTYAEEEELPEELLADREALKANLSALLQNLVVFEPNFDSVAFTTTDINGAAVNSKELFAQADYTLVNVWATTCESCIREMPDLQTLNDEGEHIQVVLLLNDADSLDSEEAQTAAEILSRQQVTLPCLLHNAETEECFPVTGTPTTYLVGSNGTVLSKTSGAKNTEEYMEWINAAIQ